MKRKSWSDLDFFFVYTCFIIAPARKLARRSDFETRSFIALGRRAYR